MSRLETPAAPSMATRVLRASSGESDWLRSSDAPLPPASEQSSTESLPTVCSADIGRDDLTGLRLGHYALGKKLGSGGMGKVFYARHLHLNRALAIKFMATDVSGSAEAQSRFEQESLALGALRHPQIVNAVDAGCIGGLSYLVTELIEGADLAKRVQKHGKLAYRDACELIRQAAIGLAYSHDSGFVHRDIKPSNLIVDQSGTVKILDFGLVRNAHLDHQLTGSGDMLGTWDFLAPEQAHDASDVDHRCDLYSLGGTLLYLLSGQVPFGGDRYATPAAKLKGHLLDVPIWLQTASEHIPRELVRILTRMMAKSPKDRFQSAHDVAAALGSLVSRETQTSVTPKATTNVRPTSSSRRLTRKAVMCLCLLVAVKVAVVVSWLHVEVGVSPTRIKAAEFHFSRVDSVKPSVGPLPVEKPPVPVEHTAVERAPVEHVAVEQVPDEPVQIHSYEASPDQLLPKTSRRITVDSNQTNGASPVIFPSGNQASQGFRRKWKTQ